MKVLSYDRPCQKPDFMASPPPIQKVGRGGIPSLSFFSDFPSFFLEQLRLQVLLLISPLFRLFSFFPTSFPLSQFYLFAKVGPEDRFPSKAGEGKV